MLLTLQNGLGNDEFLSGHFGADRVLAMAVDYAKERVQFGRPIGSFQAVKHRCADMLVDVEGMRSSVYWAAWCLSADDRDRSVAASTAKIWCSDASKRVMASGLQVHGGIGFTWEHPARLYFKRAKSAELLFGDPATAGRRFIPLLLADCKLPDTLRRYQYVDFRQETQAAFDELLAACRSETESAPPAPQPRPKKKPAKKKNSKTNTKGAKGGATPAPEQPIEQTKTKK